MSEHEPLVSIICLSYNHERFIRESMQSVFAQSYHHIEIICVDDASTDKSAFILKELQKHHSFQLIVNDENQGNCKSFNLGLKRAKGKYIIDFATDDVMFPERVTQQVSFFEALDQSYGVIYSNAVIIDEKSIEKGYHYDNKKLIHPSGEVFKELVSKYFICPPTMMMKKEVLMSLGGYDENLAYEDFDFWIRSSHSYQYAFQNEVLTARRIVSGSLSSGFYDERHQQLQRSTFKVCEKIFELCRNEEEKKALSIRIRYEMRQANKSKNVRLVSDYIDLLKQLDMLKVQDSFIQWMTNKGIKIPI